MKDYLKKWTHLIWWGWVVWGVSLSANAMQPVSYPGTSIGSADFNNHINVLSESIKIEVDDDFRTAVYHTDYQIVNNYQGVQVPVVFNTYREVDKLSITIDGQPVEVHVVPPSSEEGYQDYNSFDNQTMVSEKGLTAFNAYREYTQFIVLDLTKGQHIISTTYSVDPAYFGSDWTGISTFYYSFANFKPADEFIATKLLFAYEGDLDNISVDIDENRDLAMTDVKSWQFTDQTPANISFSYQKPLNATAKVLTSISPLFVIAVALFIFAIINFRWLKKTEKETPQYTWQLMIFTGLLFPLLAIMVDYLYLLITDLVIGVGATGERRSLFFMWVLPLSYIVATPIYLIVMFAAYVGIKEESNKETEPREHKPDNNS